MIHDFDMRYQVHIALLIFLVGCVDPFEVPSDPSNSNLLVVEGHIGDSSTEVRLTRSANLDSLEIIAESDARVFLESEDGSLSRILNNMGSGFYSIEESLTFNRHYRVRIETADGNNYVSDFVPLLRTPEIEEINLELDTPKAILDLKLSTGDPENNTTYYRWEYDETWQYTSVWDSQLKYEDGELIFRTGDQKITNCWMSEFSSNILLETSVALDRDVIANKLIASYSIARNEKFRIGNSVLIRQYALTEEEFEFWSLLEKNSETFGTLFDPQPSQLITNIVCTTNPDQLVVGYVGASSIVERRVDIKRSDLPRQIPEFNFNLNECPIESIPFDPSSINQEFQSGLKVPLYYLIGFSGISGVTSTTRLCADCRARGGTTTKPDFWY